MRIQFLERNINYIEIISFCYTHHKFSHLRPETKVNFKLWSELTINRHTRTRSTKLRHEAKGVDFLSLF